MNPITDLVFGKLSFSSGVWVGEVELLFLDATCAVQIIVEGNDDEYSIAEEQRNSFKQLPMLLPKAEDGIFDYYLSARDEYEGMDTPMPKILQKSELKDLVELTGVVFPSVSDPGEVSVGLILGCTWDPEYGVGVKIVNSTVEVGGQDLVT